MGVFDIMSDIANITHMAFRHFAGRSALTAKIKCDASKPTFGKFARSFIISFDKFTASLKDQDMTKGIFGRVKGITQCQAALSGKTINGKCHVFASFLSGGRRAISTIHQFAVFPGTSSDTSMKWVILSSMLTKSGLKVPRRRLPGDADSARLSSP